MCLNQKSLQCKKCIYAGTGFQGLQENAASLQMLFDHGPRCLCKLRLRESKGCQNLLKISQFGSQSLGSTGVGCTESYTGQCPIAGSDMGDSQKGCFWSGNLNDLMENP